MAILLDLFDKQWAILATEKLSRFDPDALNCSAAGLLLFRLLAGMRGANCQLAPIALLFKQAIDARIKIP